MFIIVRFVSLLVSMKEELSYLRPLTQTESSKISRATDVVLDEMAMTQLRALDRNHRFVTGDFFLLAGRD